MNEEIPIIGLGTRKIIHDEKIIGDAIQLGYRCFDTAWIYNNEKFLGESFKNLKVNREKIWITTKVWFDYVPNYKKHNFTKEDFGYTQLEKRFYQTLKDLHTDYLNLVLLHWPTNPDNDAQAFEKLLLLKKQGRIKNVGVSNFNKHHLNELYQRFGNEIYANQIERHIYLEESDLTSFLKSHNIHQIAYSPFGHGHLLNNKELQEYAKKTGYGVAQLSIAYLLSKGCKVIPKASSYERLKENIESLKIKLSQEEIEYLDNLPKTYRYNNTPFSKN